MMNSAWIVINRDTMSLDLEADFYRLVELSG